MVKRYQNLIICPEANLRLYVSLCDLMTIDVRDGYLFRCMVTRDQASVFFLSAAKKKGTQIRSMDKRGAVSVTPIVGSAVASRLASTKGGLFTAFLDGGTHGRCSPTCRVEIPEDYPFKICFTVFSHFCQVTRSTSSTRIFLPSLLLFGDVSLRFSHCLRTSCRG